MDENGVTGYDNDRVKQEIQTFYDSACEATTDLRNAFYNFLYDLSSFWNSPNAENYMQKYTEKCNHQISDIFYIISEISNRATDAFNLEARSHGCGGIYFPMLGIKLIPFRTPGVKGGSIIGMNKKIVTINALPTSISLYDDMYGQQVAYSCNIKGFIEKVQSLCEEMTADMNAGLASEIDSIELGAQRATQILQGN